MTKEERIKICLECKKCQSSYIERGMSEGCSDWHNDRYFGGCSEFLEMGGLHRIITDDGKVVLVNKYINKDLPIT